MAEKEKDPRDVTVRHCRLSFCDNLYEKGRSHPDGPLKFGSNFIVESDDKFFAANDAAIKAAIEAAEMKEFGKVGVIAKTVKDPKRIAYRAGEDFTDKEGDIYSGYEDNWGISAKSDKRPKLFNRKKELVDVEDIPDVFQAGYYCDAIVSFYCTSKKEQGGNGLFASIQLVRSHEEGETFGSVNNASVDDLDDLEDKEDDDDTDDLLK